MATQDPNEIWQAVFESDREKLKEALKPPYRMTAQTSSNSHSSMDLIKVDGEMLTLEAAHNERVFVAGESIELQFSIFSGLAEGQYRVNSKIKDVSGSKGNQVTVPLGAELYRLQRRNNFRTRIPVGERVVLKLVSINSSGRYSGDLDALDLSAGGMRLKWPTAQIPKPSVGDELKGKVILPNSREIDVIAHVRTIMPTGAVGVSVGVQFQKLAMRDEQTIITACVQMNRKSIT